jgi:alpha-beta hydrolase superfamily lysophospholipase
VNIVVEKGRTKDIPVINVYDCESNKKLPVVIMLHGATGKKEDNIERAKNFVKHGFYVLLFDAYGHGELAGPKAQGSHDVKELLKVYLETSRYINELINHYRNNNDFGDFERVGLMGVSMGGHTVYYHITREKHQSIKAAVPIIGSPDWVSFVRRFIKSQEGLEKVFDEAKIAGIESYISKLHPASFSDSIKDFPVMMINGELDERIEIQHIREFYAKMNETYSIKENVSFLEYKGIGHKVTESMLNNAVEWFAKYL